MMIIPRVARIALCMRQFSTASKAASKLTESARKPEARNMATAADSKMEFQRSTYYVGDTPGWTNEWYKENDSPRCLFARACCDPVHCAAHVRCLLTPVGFLFAAPSWTSSKLLLPPTVRALRRHGRAPCVSCALQARSAETATATGELMRTRLHFCRDQVSVAGLTLSIEFCSAQSSKQFMEPAILYRPAPENFERSPGPFTPNSACPCITGVTCICSFKSE